MPAGRKSAVSSSQMGLFSAAPAAAPTLELNPRQREAVARALRARGIPTEVAPSAEKFGKQIRHADRRGIPFVWFPGTDGATDEVKDIRSGEQVPADAAAWEPPADDLHPLVRSAGQTVDEESSP